MRALAARPAAAGRAARCPCVVPPAHQPTAHCLLDLSTAHAFRHLAPADWTAPREEVGPEGWDALEGAYAFRYQDTEGAWLAGWLAGWLTGWLIGGLPVGRFGCLESDAAACSAPLERGAAAEGPRAGRLTSCAHGTSHPRLALTRPAPSPPSACPALRAGTRAPLYLKCLALGPQLLVHWAAGGGGSGNAGADQQPRAFELDTAAYTAEGADAAPACYKDVAGLVGLLRRVLGL